MTFWPQGQWDPQPGIEPAPLSVEVWRLNLWTTREVPPGDTFVNLPPGLSFCEVQDSFLSPRAGEATLVQPRDSGVVCSPYEAPALSPFRRWCVNLLFPSSGSRHDRRLPQCSPCICRTENHRSFGSCKPGFFQQTSFIQETFIEHQLSALGIIQAPHGYDRAGDQKILVQTGSRRSEKQRN